MSLTKGQHLGPYDILSQIGAGGMGEVYRARDSRLARTVAIKVLPSELSNNSSLKQRFEREAKTISNLSHPHICTLHDVGHEDGIDYLVMEYLEGQTLAERLSKGPLPIDEVLRYALQICEALDKAHRQGIVHRDLKPGNIMLTKHGVKLLDFGLAKFCESGQSQIDENAPTLKQNLTEKGTILGTVQYMAPEQLEGKEADARSDIFAFGTVLYEMATAKKAFTGKSRASLMAAIIEREPERLSQIAPLIPPALDRVVAGCLAKDPEERWQTAHDLKLQLKWIRESEPELPKPFATRRRHREWALWALLANLVVLAYLGFMTAARPRTATSSVTRFEIPPPTNSAIDSIAISPSGRKLAIVSRGLRDRTQLWIRSMDTFTAQAIPKSQGAAFPFWSPDESAVAFFAEGSLKKLDLNSGVIVPLCKAENGRGGSWSPKGTIVFAPDRMSALHQVQAAGGESIPITQTATSHSVGHRWPWFLPDGEHFLYWAQTGPADETQTGQIVLSSLGSPAQAEVLVSAADNASYASGHLLYVKNGILMAAPFDPVSQRLTGKAFPIAENLQRMLYGAWMAVFTAAANGTVAYLPASGMHGSELVWYSLDGVRLGSMGNIAAQYDVRIAPNGKAACVSTTDETTATFDLWIFDLERKSPIRLTTHPADDQVGVWSPDGRWVVFSSNRNRVFNLYLKEVGSVEPEKPLFESNETKFPLDWSPDGKHLLFVSLSPTTGADIWVLPIGEESPKPLPFLVSDFDDEGSARFSPDGKWILYVSNEQRSREVFAVSFPDKRGKQKISISGGNSPSWSRDGTTIYYQDLDNYLAEVQISMDDSRLVPSVPKRLFQIQPTGIYSSFDLAPDAKRILVSTALEITNAMPLKVVLNWPLEFQKK